MQDFNSADISAYVYDTFAKDENYQELEDRDLNGKLLLDEIVQSANGHKCTPQCSHPKNMNSYTSYTAGTQRDSMIKCSI